MNSARHSPYSDPRHHETLVRAVEADVASIARAVTNVIGHYRAEDLDPSTAGEIHLRTVAEILDADQSRHRSPLAEPRPPRERVQGCCRDHSLLAVSILRSHGVPARTRVGFASYFLPHWWSDHVVAEVWEDGRWRRFDPEFVDAGADFSPHDLDQSGDGAFLTAAQAWLAWRRGERDLSNFGVGPDVPEISGPEFVRDYVIYEAAHLAGDELLLWDVWGGMDNPDESIDLELIDRLATLLVTDEEQAVALYLEDERLHPGAEVTRLDPLGGPAAVEALPARGEAAP